MLGMSTGAGGGKKSQCTVVVKEEITNGIRKICSGEVKWQKNGTKNGSEQRKGGFRVKNSLRKGVRSWSPTCGKKGFT